MARSETSGGLYLLPGQGERCRAGKVLLAPQWPQHNARDAALQGHRRCSTVTASLDADVTRTPAAPSLCGPCRVPNAGSGGACSFHDMASSDGSPPVDTPSALGAGPLPLWNVLLGRGSTGTNPSSVCSSHGHVEAIRAPSTTHRFRPGATPGPRPSRDREPADALVKVDLRLHLAQDQIHLLVHQAM